MTALHLRKLQGRNIALCFGLIDPIGAFLAGFLIAAKLRPVIDSWFQHHLIHYLAWAVALYVGCALIGLSLMAPLSLVLRGFGVASDLLKETKPKHFAFWLGTILVILSINSFAMQWVERQDPFPDYTGTALLGLVGAIVFVFGSYELAIAAWKSLTGAIKSSGIQSRDRAKFRDLSGQLALCGASPTASFASIIFRMGRPRRARCFFMASGARIVERSSLARQERQKLARKFIPISFCA